LNLWRGNFDLDAMDDNFVNRKLINGSSGSGTRFQANLIENWFVVWIISFITANVGSETDIAVLGIVIGNYSIGYVFI